MIERDAKEIKRVRMYRAAEPLFVRFGFKKTTIEDICRSAGISKRTFYEHFKDKSDFMIRMVLHVANESVADWLDSISDTADPVEKLTSFMDFYVEVMANRTVIRLFFDDPDAMAALSIMVGKDFQGNLSPIINIFRDIFREGIEKGVFRKMDEDAVTWILFAILDSIYFLLPIYFGAEGGFENESMAEEVKTFVLRAVEADHDRN